MSDLDMMRYICTDPNAGNLIEPDEFVRAIAKIKAEAWEEGHQAGWEEHESPGPFVNDYWDSKLPNPYERNNT